MSAYFVATYMDEHDVTSMERHKWLHSSHSGKGRSKREATTNTKRPDPCDHKRKALQKLITNTKRRNSSHSSRSCNCSDELTTVAQKQTGPHSPAMGTELFLHTTSSSLRK